MIWNQEDLTKAINSNVIYFAFSNKILNPMSNKFINVKYFISYKWYKEVINPISKSVLIEIMHSQFKHFNYWLDNIRKVLFLNLNNKFMILL